MMVGRLTMTVVRNWEAGSRYIKIHSRARSESSARLSDRYSSVHSISDHVGANEQDYADEDQVDDLDYDTEGFMTLCAYIHCTVEIQKG